MDRCCKNNTDISMQSKVIEPPMFKIQEKKKKKRGSSNLAGSVDYISLVTYEITRNH